MTLSELKSYRAKLLEALLVVPSGKSYTMNTGGTSKTLTRQDMPTLREELQRVDRLIARKERGRGISTRFITPYR